MIIGLNVLHCIRTGPSGLDSRSLLRPEALLPVPSSPAPSLPAANPQVYLIGMASALDFHGVHVFIQSARIAMPHAHIVIFADEVSTARARVCLCIHIYSCVHALRLYTYAPVCLRAASPFYIT